jgi:regulator of protease activity HflC (stomatin/prohibitin superfamily)
MSVFACALVTFMGLTLGLRAALALARLFGLYAIVYEGTCHVYVLFGKVLGVIEEPGLHFLWRKLGPSAALVHLFGKCHVLDKRLDQEYLRSQPVNSEEGAPMGIGIWYEMALSDPQAFLFKNTDPRGSLRANVGNTTVRALSNMKLADMLETRHAMSSLVRGEVSPKAKEWGYRLGSVYIRKVHFRDAGMVRQIEEKVVNRLKQVTSAIRQDGLNRVSLITGAAERQASIEFAKAAALRPQILGQTLGDIMQRPRVATALFEVLETQRVLESGADVTLLPKGADPGLTALVAAGVGGAPSAPQKVRNPG